jgi:hypothetical protein
MAGVRHESPASAGAEIPMRVRITRSANSAKADQKSTPSFENFERLANLLHRDTDERRLASFPVTECEADWCRPVGSAVPCA